jgi:lactate dehydrogenase-like 2-hydroxyacid dehydrogenase
MAKIVVTHGIPSGAFSILNGHQVSYPGFGCAYTREELFALLKSADAMLACGAVSAEMIDTAPELKIISNYGAGYDRIDVDAATRRGIPVTNCPECTAQPTAEIAIGLMLSCVRRIGELDRKLRSVPPESLFGMGRFMGLGLARRTLGIIGLGNIGNVVAQFGRMMNMRIVYNNRRRLSEDKEQGAEYLPLEVLLEQADIVSIHCPLTGETNNLLSADRLSLLKPTAILINTARGAIVDYQALAAMLREEKLFAAGLDVFPDEPHVAEELLALDRVVLTPHIGTNTLEARNAMAHDACVRILEALSGRRPPNVVNPEIYA